MITMKTKNSFEESGQNLIFLISQPRAGSTLLQRILGSHPEIHTVGEPWLMLNSIYALRNEGVWAEYDARLAKIATTEFIEELPGKENTFLQAISYMHCYLYEKILLNTGKSFFLDKTPRYYYIIPELHKIFPEAHFIILFRNPLGVLNSIIDTWRSKDSNLLLYRHKHDLVKAPQLLLQGHKTLAQKSIKIKYEDLLTTPEKILRMVCERIGVNYYDGLINYGNMGQSNWKMGDQGESYRLKHPVKPTVEKWKIAAGNPQLWRLFNDYLELLGPDTINQMGYNYDDLNCELDKVRPNALRRIFTVPLAFYINALDIGDKGYKLERYLFWFVKIVMSQGPQQVLHMYKLWKSDKSKFSEEAWKYFR